MVDWLDRTLPNAFFLFCFLLFALHVFSGSSFTSVVYSSIIK